MNNIINHFQSRYPQGHISFVVVACVSLILLVVLKLSTQIQINRYPEAIYTLCFLFVVITSKWMIINDRGLHLVFLGCLIPFVLLLINFVLGTDSVYGNFSATQLIKLTFFVVIGFWLGGNLNRIHVFLSLSAFGLIISIFQSDFVAEFTRIIHGKRIDFDLHNAQHTSMFFGLLLIGVFSYINKLPSFNVKSIKSWVILSVLFFSGVLAIIVVVGAQTRASWLAIIAIVIIYFALLIKQLNIKLLLISAVILLVTSIVIFQFSDTLKKRVKKEVSVVQVFLNKGIDSVPYSSIGIRLHTWDVALDKILERPFTGFGANVRKSVIQDSDKLPNHIKKNFGHFHNSYIEFTLAYGLIGLVFLLYIFIWINYRMYQIAKNDNRYKSIWYFTFYGSVFMAVINVFESYVFFWSGVYSMSILLAPAYSLHLADLYKNKVQNQ
ncbi:MAG: O-antigen ligase family protein [Saccharospirillaceae bacterium]|nr:O-antigen ligase family protein [Pseudomonadales bacterium]NRB80654.1 O-antigen ligase family protein [Saccharospirillaceae bacterium]